jgi:hypothetical protein
MVSAALMNASKTKGMSPCAIKALADALKHTAKGATCSSRSSVGSVSTAGGAKRGPGRPKKNEEKRGPGRPLGSKNKPKEAKAKAGGKKVTCSAKDMTWAELKGLLKAKFGGL